MRSPHFDATGQTFGRLTAQKEVPPVKGHRTWLCLCECGSKVLVSGYGLRSNHTQSCGCLQRERCGDANRTHGRYGDPIYFVWAGIVQRCTNPNSTVYYRYGGAGITVCKRWLKFENFLADMGERPAGHSVDRINGAKGYSPSNCRWATRQMQRENNKDVVWYEHRGKKMTLDTIAALEKIPRTSLYRRVKEYGWLVTDAISKAQRK